MQNHIVNAARGWIGTRFHHQGRCKKSSSGRGGVDCIGLIVGVAEELGIMSGGKMLHEYDRTDYASIPNGNELYSVLQKHFIEIPVDKIAPGDILLFRFAKNPQHVGIVGNHPSGALSIIHSYIEARGVVEHLLDEKWMERAVAGFRVLSS